MNRDKIKVAFIYKKSYIFLSGKCFDNTTYYFFMHALKRNNRLDVIYFPCENNFDVSELKDKFDIILLPLPHNLASPDNIIGIDKLNIPVVCRAGDPHHDAKKYGKFAYHEKYKIDHYFNFMHESYFHKFYPKNFNYKTIIFGVEPLLYQNLTPFRDRIKDRILSSGEAGRPSLLWRTRARILHPQDSMWYFYKLRTMCIDLPYVDYQRRIGNKYPNDDYPTYLSRSRAAIAATTYYPTLKYLEIPAAGCLTFMEITDTNKGDYLGYKDGKTAIFINEKNYQDKFQEYLQSVDNPEWEEVAAAGRNYTLNELSNDKAVDSLADLMESYV